MRAREWVVWVVVIAGGCAPKGQPTLEIKLSPKTVTDGTPVQVTVIGTAGDGKIGTGAVKVTSARGSLATPVQVPLDSFGTATAELICDPSAEPECLQAVRVVAEWTSEGIAVTAEARLNSAGTVAAGGGAGGGGGGGPFQPGAGKVMLLGYLTGESRDCLKRGLVDPRTPQAVQVSFGCYIKDQSAILYNDEVYYTEFGKPGIRKFRADTWGFVNGVSVLPSPDENPDVAILEECGTIEFFQISNTGRILHDCHGMGYSVNGQPLSMTLPITPAAFGEGDSFLLSDAVLTADGVSHHMTITSGSVSLPVSGGFLVAKTTGPSACSLYFVGLSGRSTVVGSFPVACDVGKLDESGAFTFVSSDGANRTIVQVKPNGTPETIFSDANRITPNYSINPPLLGIEGPIPVSGN